MDRKRYTIDDITNNTFYQMPKFLFQNDFKKLSNDARVLYALLKDRHDLSIKNQWINDAGEVYLIYSRENMILDLGISQPTLRKAINQLKKYNLLEEERQGQGKANLIYLLSTSTINTKSEKIFQSRVKKSFSQECKNFSPNNTNINNTNNNNNKAKNPNSKDNVVVEKNNSKINNINQNDIDKVKDIIQENISDLDIIKLLEVSKNNLEVIKEKYNIAKQYPNKINNLVSFLIVGIVKDYQSISVEPSQQNNNCQTNNKNKFMNYEQREWDFEELEKLEYEYMCNYGQD